MNRIKHQSISHNMSNLISFPPITMISKIGTSLIWTSNSGVHSPSLSTHTIISAFKHPRSNLLNEILPSCYFAPQFARLKTQTLNRISIHSDSVEFTLCTLSDFGESMPSLSYRATCSSLYLFSLLIFYRRNVHNQYDFPRMLTR